MIIKGVLMQVSGKDSTEEFFALHRQEVLDKMGPKFVIGLIKGIFLRNPIK
jgi:hypothetical protein